MRLGQIRWNNQVTAAIFEPDGSARPVPDYTMYDLIRLSEMEKAPIHSVARRLAATHPEHLSPIIPLNPREVWGCGCTYECSAQFRDSEHGTREGFYAHVYREERPEIFFKGTSRFCVGPGQNIGIRPDSNFTAPEPELALILGSQGKIVGYTIANDVSAWDIERQNPLYLPQSKMYTGCCALGPVIVTADELSDAANLDMSMSIRRTGSVLWEGSCSTSTLHRKLEQLIEFLLRANPVPGGSVLLTGTGIIAPQEAALKPGDVVEITIPEIGTLANIAAVIT